MEGRRVGGMGGIALGGGLAGVSTLGRGVVSGATAGLGTKADEVGGRTGGLEPGMGWPGGGGLKACPGGGKGIRKPGAGPTGISIPPGPIIIWGIIIPGMIPRYGRAIGIPPAIMAGGCVCFSNRSMTSRARASVSIREMTSFARR